MTARPGEEMLSAVIVNIQKYCIHDGDGIRTTIFFKGCPLSCQWCHNPESQDFGPQLMVSIDRCRGCGLCVAVCPEKGLSMDDGISHMDREKCTACGECANACAYGVREIVGTRQSVDALVRLAEQDRMFYETSGGGVTLSGGEVMCQDKDFLVELAQKLKRKGLHLTVDTCGFAPWETFAALLPYVDCFLYDIKLIDAGLHEKTTGKDNVLVLSNLKKLSEAGAPLHIRIPVIDGVNSSDAEMDRVIQVLRQNMPIERVSLLPYHPIGEDKRARLGMESSTSDFHVPDECRMREILERFKQAGFSDVQVGG
jgi:pyruvate formate lyase activating enzyme